MKPIKHNCVDDDELKIGEHIIERGQTRTFDYHIGRIFGMTELAMPVRVMRGKEPGPVLFVCGCIHGDEIIGAEIIKRLLHHKQLHLNCGSLIAIPIVNVFGYNAHSRYLPDRRDLNRSFPGSPQGSLASRLAHIILKDFVMKSSYGIDLHSAAIHRSNFPQIRADLDIDPQMAALARAFGAPVVLNSKNREGSVRSVAQGRGVKMLVYEGGEALRLDEEIVKIGVVGILNVMESIGMIDPPSIPRPTIPSFIAQSSYWLRAPQSGSVRPLKTLGAKVKVDTKLGTVSDVFGNHSMHIVAKSTGIIIGDNRVPLVNRGDAVFHVATFDDEKTIVELAERYSDLIDHLFV